MKARADMATMIGWNAEQFARTKRVKPLGHYLKPTKPRTAESGARDVRRMLERLMKREGDENGAR